jgi:hypothetical protein
MARPSPSPGSPRAPGSGRSGRRCGAGPLGDARARGRAPRRALPAVHRDRLPGGSTCGRCRAGCRRPGPGGRRGVRPSTPRASRSNVTSCVRPWVAARPRRPARGGRAGAARATGSWSPRASSARSPTRSVSSWSWTRTSSTSTERSARVSSSTRRMTSRLVRRLVSGVRSSWEASSTSWLWARRDDSRASSSRLKVRRSRPSSSGPPGSRAGGRRRSSRPGPPRCR